MKRALHRILQGTGWSLVAAGTVGLSTGAAGQNSSSAPLAVPRPGSSVHPAHLAAWLTENYARLAEMRVELAWLADPKTYPYRLGARANGMALEVRGYVPTDSVRQHALRVAREETGLEIVDALRLQPRLSPRTTLRAPEALQHEAVRALQETFPQFGRHLEVQAGANGQLTVAGTVNSYEEKLVVSHRLSRLSGCQSIVNNLCLQPVHQEGRQYTRVTSDGKLLVPSEDAPTQPTTLVSQLSPAPLDGTMPNGIQPAAYQGDATSRPSEPAVQTPQPGKPPAPAASQTGLSQAPRAPGSQEPSPTYVPAPTRPPQPTLAFASGAPGTSPSAPAPANPNAPAPPIRYYQTQWRRPEMAGQPPARVTPSASVEAQVSASTAASANAGASATSAPYVTTGVVLLETAEPVPTVTERSTSAPVQPPPEQPVVTTGVILIEIPEPLSPEPLPAAPPVIPKLVETPAALPPVAPPPVQKPVESTSAPLPGARPAEQKMVGAPPAPLPAAQLVVPSLVEAPVAPLPASPAAVARSGVEQTSASLPPVPPVVHKAVEPSPSPLPAAEPLGRRPIGALPTPPPAAPAVVGSSAEATRPLPAVPLVVHKATEPTSPLPATPPGGRTAIEAPHPLLLTVPPVVHEATGSTAAALPAAPPPPASARVRHATEPTTTLPAAAPTVAKSPEKASPAPLPAAPARVQKAPEPTSPSAPTVPPPPVRNAVETRLKQRIEAVCAGEAQNVEIEVQANNRVQIRLKARSDRTGERLSARIFQMPELGPYHVALDIQLAP